MPKTKVSKKSAHSIAKKSSLKKMREDVAVPVTKSEPAYININEYSAEIAAKSRTLWTIVTIFSIILAIFWIIMLRNSIRKETANIGFNQIGDQISKSLARFDTEIKNRSEAKPITAEDMAAIRNGLEDSIKNNPDSSLWPTHEYSSVNLSIQYPSDWFDAEGIDFLVLSDTKNAVLGSNRITINRSDNPKKFGIEAWITRRNNGISDYSYIDIKNIQPFPLATAALESIVVISTSTSASNLDETIFINSTSTKEMFRIDLQATGDISYYKPIMEEIVRTIKILK